MDVDAAHDLIHQVGNVRSRARADRRLSSVPLLAFGALTFLDALVRMVVDPLGAVAMLLLAPAGFAFVALYYRRREITTGAGGRTGPYALAAVVVLVTLPFIVFFGVYAVVGVGLLVIAARQRNLYLAVWAVIYGVLGSLESFYVISNRLDAANAALGWWRSQGGYLPWASSLVYACLGASLIAAGLVAQRREGAWR